VVFTCDNGTARFGVELAKVNGKPISGQKFEEFAVGSNASDEAAAARRKLQAE
jgi:hypothetical protein